MKLVGSVNYVDENGQIQWSGQVPIVGGPWAGRTFSGTVEEFWIDPIDRKNEDGWKRLIRYTLRRIDVCGCILLVFALDHRKNSDVIDELVQIHRRYYQSDEVKDWMDLKDLRYRLTDNSIHAQATAPKARRKRGVGVNVDLPKQPIK